MESPLISLCNVSKRYSFGERSVLALDDVSLRIGRGEFVAITGRSGSGKSSLLNLLGCLDRPDAGELVIDGVNVGDAHVDELADVRNRCVGFVFQHFNLLPQFSAIENVALPLRYGNSSRAEHAGRARVALGEVGLAAWESHRPGQLSGGQQQRVAIARALVTRPRLVLADEPTGALDSATAGDILGLLRAVSDSGVTVVLVTHDEGIAAATGRRIRLHDGRVASDDVSA